jgi:hypothetical protein
MTKRILAYLFHLAIATLAVPMFAFFLTGSAYWLIRRALAYPVNPQQFYSDYFLSVAAITGLWLAYSVCDTFTSRGAMWIWIPSTLGFIIRILVWRAAGSVFFHSGMIEHFFTADCQAPSWQEPDFASRCADRLFLTPLAVGSLAYSAGAVIRRRVHNID